MDRLYVMSWHLTNLISGHFTWSTTSGRTVGLNIDFTATFGGSKLLFLLAWYLWSISSKLICILVMELGGQRPVNENFIFLRILLSHSKTSLYSSTFVSSSAISWYLCDWSYSARSLALKSSGEVSFRSCNKLESSFFRISKLSSCWDCSSSKRFCASCNKFKNYLIFSSLSISQNPYRFTSNLSKLY